MDHVLAVPQGSFELRRAHHDPAAPLRAWDAADELALNHLHEVAADGARWLVVNDAFGALATAVAARRPVSWTDSVLAIDAARANLARNGLDPDACTFVPATEVPGGPVDVAVVKVPRALALLDDQLRRLRPALHAGSVVVGAGMTWSVHRSTIEAFEAAIGPTPTSRARKKARLLLPTVDPALAPPPPAAPATWTTDEGVAVVGCPGTFSAGALDPGTRLLLAHLPPVAAGEIVVDLGCGTGVVAATAAVRCAGARIVCCDESFLAVESARRTVSPVAPDAAFHVTDVFDGVPDESADLVACNPPFHAGGARTTSVARRMFAESRRVLRPGGRMVVVANRHLGHHVALRRWFADVEVAGSDPRFVVLQGRRR